MPTVENYTNTGSRLTQAQRAQFADQNPRRLQPRWKTALAFVLCVGIVLLGCAASVVIAASFIMSIWAVWTAL